MSLSDKILVPQEILKDFDVVDVQEFSDSWVIVLEEKPERIPTLLAGREAVLDGFYDTLDLISGVLMEQVIYLRIRRRRWKESGHKVHVHNSCDHHFKGMRTTKRFATFLKEIDGYQAD